MPTSRAPTGTNSAHRWPDEFVSDPRFATIACGGNQLIALCGQGNCPDSFALPSCRRPTKFERLGRPPPSTMSHVAASYQVSAATLSMGRRFYPRRYQRFPGLHAPAEAVAWSRALDWRDNPYSRFLLRRELLRFVATRAGTDPRHNVFWWPPRKRWPRW